ncbi:MAG TPA: glycosyltransferase [Gemmatimonadota bacterium]|jgi:glycosyltransferase involved in cell wall biosynthesis
MPRREDEVPFAGDFAVVVPAFDEEENVLPLAAALRETFDRHGLAGEVVLVDDGSRDRTRALAQSVDWDAWKVVAHGRNRGKTEALLTGAAATTRSILILFDADLQHSPEEIPRFLRKLGEGFDLVAGRKVGAYEKQGVSAAYNALSRRLFGVPVHDLNSMKAFRRDVLSELPLRHDWHRFFAVLAHDRGFRLGEIDITLYPRERGTSKYRGSWRIVSGFLDLLAVKIQLSFMERPLILFGVTSGILVLLGVAIGLFALYQRFVLEHGYRPLGYLSGLLVVLGVLAFALGFLAEGIGQVRDRVQHLERSLRQDAGVQAQRERPGPSTAPPGQSPERSPAQAASPATPPGRGEAAHRQ